MEDENLITSAEPRLRSVRREMFAVLLFSEGLFIDAMEDMDFDDAIEVAETWTRSTVRSTSSQNDFAPGALRFRGEDDPKHDALIVEHGDP